MVRAHKLVVLHGTRQLLQVVGSRKAEQDARVLRAIIEQMEYKGLLKGADAHADGQMLAMLTRYLQLVLASA